MEFMFMVHYLIPGDGWARYEFTNTWTNHLWKTEIPLMKDLTSS